MTASTLPTSRPDDSLCTAAIIGCSVSMLSQIDCTMSQSSLVMFCRIDFSIGFSSEISSSVVAQPSPKSIFLRLPSLPTFSAIEMISLPVKVFSFVAVFTRPGMLCFRAWRATVFFDRPLISASTGVATTSIRFSSAFCASVIGCAINSCIIPAIFPPSSQFTRYGTLVNFAMF